jgi:capsular exopolysaccharide synthesis family protein
MQDTNVLEVRYQSKNPNAAAAIVDSVLSAYLKFMDKLHKSTAQELLDILTKEKVALEKQLQVKESELLAARLRAGDLVIRDKDQGLNVVVQRVMRLNESLIVAHAKRLEAQSRTAAIDAAIRNGGNLWSHALAMTDAVGRDVLLQQLGISPGDAYTISRTNQQLLDTRARLQSELQRYGPAHRRVRILQEQIRVAEQYLQGHELAGDASRGNVDNARLKPLLMEVAHQQLQQTIDHENRIRVSYEQEKQRAITLDRSTAQLEMLQLDVHRLRGFYDVVLERIKDIDLGSENGMLRTSVLSRPQVPSSPIEPRLSMVVFMAVLCGLAGGLGVIYVQDLLDDRFRSPEELRMQLGTPVLATVQAMETNAEAGIDAVLAHAQPTSVKSEPFRTLRTALTFCNGGARRLVISSTEPGDGKTTVSANLAVVYAQAGKRTLLIDADMRRPGLTTLLDMRGEQGLSTCLASEGPIAEAAAANLYRSLVDNLDVIPSGPRPVNAIELLSSDRFAELLSWAEVNYDQIVIDSSPSLVSDTAIIGQVVDGVVLVVQPAKNHRRAVIRATDNLSLLGVKLQAAGHCGQSHRLRRHRRLLRLQLWI